MIYLWLWAMGIAVIIGLGLKFGAQRAVISNETGSYYQITWIEFAVVLAVMALIVIPVTTHVGLNMAKASKLTYHEFWGGYETATLTSSQECHRDGGCNDTYECDPYEVSVVVTDYDSKGNAIGSHIETHTEYHHCPVATRENYWAITTTLGKYDLGMTFDANAVAFRDSHGLDDTFQGVPPLWAAADKRIKAGDPGPVTADKTYDNYILASTRTILHKYSDAVSKYQKLGLLPNPVVNLKQPIYDHYYADKMAMFGLHEDAVHWNFALDRLDAALGTGLQGDLHVVAIDAGKIDNPDEYAGAVNAFWQSPLLGKRALSKNGIGLVLGIKNSNIAWARAFTGMPVGNAGLVLDLQNNLKDQPFTTAIFGHPQGVLTNGSVSTIQHGDSPVEAALWGPHKFHREHMKDFHYLGSEIQPSNSQKRNIILVAILFIIIGWLIALAVGIGDQTTADSRY